MMPPSSPPEPSGGLRASDAERERVAEALRRGRRVVAESARELLAALDDDEVDTLVDLLARVAASEGVESPGF